MSFKILKIVISGRVQMVGFRWFAKQQADILGIRGYVRNTSRGNVEILAEGNEKDLNTFIDYLRKGPSRARVDDIKRRK
ncbi:MAG: acylphosphatase [Candidatus Marinimicrobia bacterium]|nr:acylphosphatase [Candidatus Neomarinimicrobiota bacterium]